MKIISFAAASFGFLGVALGAFGAHALKSRLTEAGMSDVWDTAVLYHLVHATAAVAVTFPSVATEIQAAIRRAAAFWLAGVLLFSGSLYFMALGGPRWLGPITPLGGLCFLIGWAMLAWTAAKRR